MGVRLRRVEGRVSPVHDPVFDSTVMVHPSFRDVTGTASPPRPAHTASEWEYDVQRVHVLPSVLEALEGQEPQSLVLVEVPPRLQPHEDRQVGRECPIRQWDHPSHPLTPRSPAVTWGSPRHGPTDGFSGKDGLSGPVGPRGPRLEWATRGVEEVFQTSQIFRTRRVLE